MIFGEEKRLEKERKERFLREKLKKKKKRRGFKA